MVYDGACPVAPACTILFMLCLSVLCNDIRCYYVLQYPLRHVLNETKYYVCHVKLCDEYHVYMMYICTMSWMKGKNRMMLILCYVCKSWGSHACMYVTCIRMLPRYVILVQTRSFDIYFYHDIMWAFLFL